MYIRKLAFLSCLLFGAFQVSAQTLTVQVNNINDDMEEWIAGAGQTKTVGNLDGGSSDLEIGTEAINNGDPQVVGIRFNNITIPKGALITSAYIQFTVDATSKNTDPCNVWIRVQDSDNPVTFNPASPFNISSRPMVADSVNWVVPTGTWTTVNAAGPDQATSDIAKLVQRIVDRSGWSSGNSIVFTIKGSGLRESKSYDLSATDAAKLIINYMVPTTVTFPITAADDDMEEWIAGPGQTKTVGLLDAGSSDLELGTEATSNGDPQIVGMRFTGLNIPKRAYIKSAYLQFTVDATAKNTDPNNLVIKVQDADNPVTFNPAVNFNITSRAKINDSVTWTTPAGTWTTVNAAGPDQRSTNIARLLQSIVDRNGWTSGNAVAFFITGTGLRESKSYDLSPTDAVKLIVEYIPVTTVTYPILAADDDQEEWIAGAGQTKTVGTLDAGSSDLEFGTESSGADPQMVGMRFANVQVPKNAIIRDARIRFTVDATNKNSDPVNVWVKAQNADNPVTFNPANSFDITSRSKIADSVNWVIPNGTWTTVGASGADQTTTNIAKLTQALVNRTGWTSGNAMAYFMHGTGTREAESYDGSAPDAAKLIIEYVGGPGGSTSPSTYNPPVNYPLPAKADWSFIDTGNVTGAWKTAAYNDSAWGIGKAALGYNALDLGKTVSYGTDSNNKHIATYYRKRLNISDVNLLPNNLEFRLRCDDGAVVYINGTEVLRVNMPTSAVTNSTPSTVDVKSPNQDAYFVYDIPKTGFISGTNIVAVEVHQFAANNKDHVFDLSITNPTGISNPMDIGCNATTDIHIGCFTSLTPRPQNDTFQLPTTHVFQFLSQTGDPLTIGTGNVKSNFDFTGYVPKAGSSTQGWIDLNHERGNKTGGVTVFTTHFDIAKGLWVIDSSGEVDFSMVAATQANCSGGVTYWETSITCEEDYPGAGDANSDGYIDMGWMVEVDPKTRKPRDYGNGPEKLWAAGRMSHENVVVHKDNKTLYYGEDDGLGAVYKFVADTAANLRSGKVYVLKLDNPMVSGEPTGTTGTWVSVPNATVTERNNVKMFGTAMGTTFSGVEDVEIGTLDSQIYFTAKGLNRVYRFIDNGTTVTGFMTYVGGRSYRVSSGNGVVSEDWGGGNDNLTFDDRGNLWVLQDGGRNHVWVVRPGHTQINPKIEVFMHLPRESEPTGMTFTPDHKFMFISIQEPGTSITTSITDIANVTKVVNKSTMMVIARKEVLGVPKSVQEVVVTDKNVRIYPNPFTDNATLELDIQDNKSRVHIEVIDIMGKTVQDINPGTLDRGIYKYTISGTAAGFYFCNVTVNGIRNTYKVVKR